MATTDISSSLSTSVYTTPMMNTRALSHKRIYSYFFLFRLLTGAVHSIVIFISIIAIVHLDKFAKFIFRFFCFFCFSVFFCSIYQCMCHFIELLAFDVSICCSINSTPIKQKKKFFPFSFYVLLLKWFCQ